MDGVEGVGVGGGQKGVLVAGVGGTERADFISVPFSFIVLSIILTSKFRRPNNLSPSSLSFGFTIPRVMPPYVGIGVSPLFVPYWVGSAVKFGLS